MTHQVTRLTRVVLLAILCGLSQIALGTPFRMVLQWEHQSQFAGYYMAQDKGFYQDAGLEVTLISGGADVDPFELVRSGQADACSAMLSTVLETYKKDQGHLVLLAQVINRSNLALIAWKHGKNGNTSIETPADLNHKTITVWDAYHAPYHCFLDRYQLTPTILPQYYSFSLFLHKGTDAFSAMLYNEYHTLLQCDVDETQVTVFDFYALGINLPEDGIYCTDKTWQSQPKACNAFAAASMKGWDYARQHPDETLDEVMRRVNQDNLPTNRAHMQWMLKTILASIYPPDGTAWIPGQLSQASYRDALTIMGMNTSAPGYLEFVTQEAPHDMD